MASKRHSHPTAAKSAKESAAAPETTLANPGAELTNPDLYINRELSLLEFQCRVLEEATDEDNPLLERVKFLAILGSNLDEFFMVRVAGLMKQVASGAAEVGYDGRPPAEQLQMLRATRVAASGLSRSMRWQTGSRSSAAGTDQRTSIMDAESAEVARPPAHA
jgi:polyphosphate kinase